MSLTGYSRTAGETGTFYGTEIVPLADDGNPLLGEGSLSRTASSAHDSALENLRADERGRGWRVTAIRVTVEFDVEAT